MQWQLYAELNPYDRQKNQGDVLEAAQVCLAGLGLTPDVLARIHAVLTNYLGSANQPVVRVLVSLEQKATSHPTQHDWRFFIVASGSPATADQTQPCLELYLY